MAKVKRLLGIIVILALVISGSALFFASFVLLPAQADEPPEKIEELQQWVDDQGYNYTVAENWVTQLSPEEREALCGSRSVQPPDEPLPENMGFVYEVPSGEGGERFGQPPATYDAWALGYVTPVKAQLGCGSCWIFAATADFESDVAIGEASLLDFAEQEVGDCHIYYSVGGYNWCLGGNANMTTNFFTKKGSANETCHPYVATLGTCQNCTILRNVDNWRMITGINGESQITTIKNAILAYGPVHANMYASDPTFFAYSGGVYEYWGTDATDHMIEIIGWDDSKTHSGPIQGAWMIKNSWGTGWGAGHTYPGCAWVAYGSANLGDWTSALCGYGNPPLAMFYHDEGGWMNWCLGDGATTTAWGAARFTPSQDETLTAVDFWAVDVNMGYEIKIFDTLTGSPGNYSFSSQLGTTQTGTTGEGGYYSIPLSTPVSLTSGDDFIVQVKLTSGTSGWYYPIPIDYYDATSHPWLPLHSSVATFSGESYFSTGGTTFAKPAEDVGIRARAEDTTPPADPTNVSSDPAESTWSTDNTVEVTWTDSVDAGSGLDGYSILWDTTSNTVPDDTIDIQENVETATSAPLADGDSHYFHIRAVDNAGNWVATVHVGPFFIDTTEPAAVTDLATSNPTRTSMDLSWTAPGDDTSGTATYDIRYSTSNITVATWDTDTQCTGEPTPSADGSAENFTVPSLTDATTYYFAIKTADKVSLWSDLSNVASGTTQNSPPVLSDGAVSPTSGYTSTTFTYSVVYTDADNDPPASPMVSIDDGLPEDMAVKAGDSDYTDGETYEYIVTGADLGRGSHTFQFGANDGIDDATGDIGSHDGPTVRSRGGGGGGGGGRDTRAPVISNIECADCTKTSIIIKWRTDERSTSQVESWASEHMFSPLDENLVTYHEVELTNLKPCCVYHFRTISKDSSGNEAISEEDTFTTLGTPATFDTSGLTISPAEVQVGESIAVSVLVTNTGDATGTYASTLKLDNIAVATKEVTLAGGASQTVTFTRAEDVAGTYTVGVNGLTGIFTVKAPAAFTTSTLDISPAEVNTGEDITISALVTNTGDLTGTYEVTLEIDEIAVATKSVTLAGGASEKVTFTMSEDVAATYTVNLNGLLGTFVVNAGLSWWLIGGIIAAVVAAGLLVYFYVWRKRGVSRLT